jgi:methylthioribose-1-phosphate isomerase
MKAVEWADGVLMILDQTRLPHQEVVIEARTVEEVTAAIRTLAVRGAPLLGIAAAYGMALAARAPARTAMRTLRELERAATALVGSRPTAVNIAWAVDRVLRSARAAETGGVDRIRQAVTEEAKRIAWEDEASCLAIGRLGADLLPPVGNVLTHCNTGALATGGVGTAQGMIVTAHRGGKRLHVWVGETRPLLQGARLTAWELQRLGVPMTLVADTAAGSLMARGLVDAVVVGADRIAANGDVANKVGTLSLAILARHHRIPFYVAAPMSTIDLSTRDGQEIVIEERDPSEVLSPAGVLVAPSGTPAGNPAFDVTPADLVGAIVTDRGVAMPPLRAALRRLAKAPGPAGEPGSLQEVS